MRWKPGEKLQNNAKASSSMIGKATGKSGILNIQKGISGEDTAKPLVESTHISPLSTCETAQRRRTLKAIPLPCPCMMARLIQLKANCSSSCTLSSFPKS